MNTERLLTPSETADLLRCKTQTLACWRSCKRYSLPWVKVGRSIRYKAADVERFVAEQTVGAVAVVEAG